VQIFRAQKYAGKLRWWDWKMTTAFMMNLTRNVLVFWQLTFRMLYAAYVPENTASTTLACICMALFWFETCQVAETHFVHTNAHMHAMHLTRNARNVIVHT
jgi:hypothetical protein